MSVRAGILVGMREDIESAAGRMATRMFVKAEVKKLDRHLLDGERVDHMVAGAYGDAPGLLVLTDRRLLFISEKVMNKRSEDFALKRVSSVEWSHRMGNGEVKIFTSGNEGVIKNVLAKDGERFVREVRGRLLDL